MTVTKKGRGVIYYPETNTHAQGHALLVLGQKLATMLSDADAVEIAILFAPWAAGATYEKGTRLRHGQTTLYKVMDTHTATTDCPPGTDDNLYQPLTQP